MNVLVLAHGPEIEAGWLQDALEEAQADATVVDLSLGEVVPEVDWDRIVVLGGHMGAYDVDEHPWLAAEKDFIRTHLAAETPLLGVCLGAQLVAEAIGGRAYRAPGTEVGFVALDITPAGKRDPVLAAITGPVVAWHHDTFELPPETELLAFSAAYPHAFRHGTALGVQFHPEVTPEMWDRWAASAPGELSSAGLDAAAFSALLVAEAERLRAQAVAFFRTWLEE